MDLHILSSRLADLPIPEIRYFAQTGSTNDEALKWAGAGAKDGCLVVANSQTKGRGRLGRHWVTQPGSALAFSLILRPTSPEMERIGLFSPLGAIAICQALEAIPGIYPDRLPKIKWPNDVLLDGKKAAGILVESAWLGDRLQNLIIGIGLNITREAVPPSGELLFPAISVEDVSSGPVDRVQILHAILKHLFSWRERLPDSIFLEEWARRLAYRNEWVQVSETGGKIITGQVVGVDRSGGLLLRNPSGDVSTILVGDLRLRPLE